MTEPVAELGRVEHVVSAIGAEPSRLVAILTAVQRELGYLPQDVLRHIGQLTGVSLARVEGVAGFYPQFRLSPAGKHTVRVCIGTACYVKGADQVFDAFKDHLAISEDDDTDDDGLFTVDRVACLGCCMMAPAVQIGDTIYGQVHRDSVPTVLDDFMRSRDGPAATVSPPAAETQTAGEIRLCTCSSCAAAGAERLFAGITDYLAAHHIPVSLRESGCTGLSYKAPIVRITDAAGRETVYGAVTPRAIAGIVDRHFPAPTLRGQLAQRADGFLERILTGTSVVRLAAESLVDLARGDDAVYWQSQERVVTQDLTMMDPLDLAEYRSRGGFEALAKAREVGPDQTISLVEASGLRGRGGAGYPTGLKWRQVREAAGSPKTVICNADEGDPGAFMDRMILESLPFRVIEGVAIAALAVGTVTVIVYVRSEYPRAIHRLGQALDICRRAGVMESLHVEIVEGAGAFVCGEETALIAAIEGRRPNPRVRPPYPSEEGLHGAPTLVNNVETLATIPWIVRGGALRAYGTEESPGTKAFALAGKINRGGLVEVPMGTSLLDLVHTIGGGIQGEARLKAVQIGGPSGGCIPAELCHLPIDYEKLTTAGAMMGSGGIIVLDEHDCMVAIARYFMEFTAAESCGKCSFCRIGTRRMLEILSALCAGEATTTDLSRLEELAHQVAGGSLCSLGKTAPNPVLSALRHFRDEFEAHVEGQCPAGRCKDLICYEIGQTCISCTRCAQSCPVSAITGVAYQRHRIDPSLCIRCGTCSQVCPEGAVTVQ